MQKESRVLNIMPTRKNKNLMFMLPAFCKKKKKITIMVMPLIILKQNIKKQCKKLEINCQEWKNKKPPDEASMVLMTLEAALGNGFTTFMN